MRYLFAITAILIFSMSSSAQQLEKLRAMCIDEVDLAQYEGNLSQAELEKQVAAFGFMYIENGDKKYHKDLLVHDCNNGSIKFTAVFDENRLVEEFTLYENKDQLAKTIYFSERKKSPLVNLNFHFKGQEFPAHSIEKAEVFRNGVLDYHVVLSEESNMPVVSIFNRNGDKTSEGTARITGKIQEDWKIEKIGEWKYYDNGVLSFRKTYDRTGTEELRKIYENGKLAKQIVFINSDVVETSLYFPNGNIEETGRKNGSFKIGTWSYYNRQGKIKEKVTYSDGMIQSRSVYNKESTVIKKLELVNGKSELNKKFRHLKSVYNLADYHADGSLKTSGLLHQNKKIGVFESYKRNGELSKIIEYNENGEKIYEVKAETYELIKRREKEVFREILVTKTTHPKNLSLISNIKYLSTLLSLDFDSVVNQYNYEKEFEEKLLNLEKETDQFGDLSTPLPWYDSLLAQSERLTDETWVYNNTLLEKELALEKEVAIEEVEGKIQWLDENHTSSKETLFGTKTIVENDQEELYEFLKTGLAPSVKIKIKESDDKYEVSAILINYIHLIEKASEQISDPNQIFQDSLKKLNNVQDKRKLLLSLE